MTLSAEVANESQEVTIRNAAGIALKNALSARVCSFYLSSLFHELTATRSKGIRAPTRVFSTMARSAR